MERAHCTQSDYLKLLELLLGEALNTKHPLCFKTQNPSSNLIDYGAEYTIEGNEFDSLSPCITYILDIRAMCYQHLSNNFFLFTGYSAEEILYKGIYFAFSRIHPQDRHTLVDKILKTQVEFVRNLAHGEHSKYRFSYTYRFKRADNVYIQILNQDRIISVDDQGNPLFVIGTYSDITHLKTDDKISLVSYKYEEGKGFNCQICHSKSDNKLLSERELEVLELILKGKKTSQIANILQISPHTVKNHRKNILNRAGANNMAEATKLAFEEGLL